MKSKCFAFLGALLLMAGCREKDQSRSGTGPVPEENGAAGSALPSGKTLESDTALNLKVRQSLDGLLTNQETNDFRVESHARVVTVKGRVGNTSLKDDIARSIKQTDGVIDVRNEIQVDPGADLTMRRNEEAQKALKDSRKPLLPFSGSSK